MNPSKIDRKQFLRTAAEVGAVAALFTGLSAICFGKSEHGKPSGAKNGSVPTGFKGKRATTTFTAHLEFPPEAIFPLLCPVREYEWIDGWRCEMIYSDSGIAEDNCIFKTAHNGEQFWSVSHYEPLKRIEFVTFRPEQMITRLNISLTPSATGTEIRWTRTFTGLTPAGNDSIGTWTAERDADITRQLEHYLKTGSMLRS